MPIILNSKLTWTPVDAVYTCTFAVPFSAINAQWRSLFMMFVHNNIRNITRRIQHTHTHTHKCGTYNTHCCENGGPFKYLSRESWCDNDARSNFECDAGHSDRSAGVMTAVAGPNDRHSCHDNTACYSFRFSSYRSTHSAQWYYVFLNFLFCWSTTAADWCITAAFVLFVDVAWRRVMYIN